MKKKVLVILMCIFISVIFTFKETITIRVCNFIDQRAIKKSKYFTEQQVNISGGKNTKKIAQILKDKKVIFSEIRFIILVKMLKAEKKLKSGEYKFNNKMTTLQVIKRLQKGGMALCKFTIPEGYDFKKIAASLAKEGLVNKDRFLNLCYDVSFLKEKDQKNCINLEGYLFPDTYKISVGLKEEDIIKMMIDRFYQVAESVYKDKKKKILSFSEMVILASLIEKEAKASEERRMISAVFHNRLKRRMPLSSCATVIYSLGGYKKKLCYEDLKIVSPYNTYLKIGLPPGPICSPGKKALQAALNPAHTNHLYFVSLGNGRHKFSNEYKQHEKIKQHTKVKNNRK